MNIPYILNYKFGNFGIDSVSNYQDLKEIILNKVLHNLDKKVIIYMLDRDMTDVIAFCSLYNMAKNKLDKIFINLCDNLNKSKSDYEVYVNTILEYNIIKNYSDLYKFSKLFNIPLYEYNIPKVINTIKVDLTYKLILVNDQNISIFDGKLYHIGNINSVQSTKLLRDFGLLDYYYLEYFNINENTYTHNIRSDIIIKDCSNFETYDDLIDYIDYNTAENYFNENNFPIQDFCDYLLYLRLVDCAIYNYDRHTGNIIYFQYISDNSIHIAPIHDFDCSFDVDCYEISNTCFDILKYGLYLCDDNIDLYNYLINLPENHYLYDYIQTFILNKFKFSTNFGSFS